VANGLVGKAPGGVMRPDGVASPFAEAPTPSFEAGAISGVAAYHVPPKLAVSWPVTCPASSWVNVCSGHPLHVTSVLPSAAVVTPSAPLTPFPGTGDPRLGGEIVGHINEQPGCRLHASWPFCSIDRTYRVCPLLSVSTVPNNVVPVSTVATLVIGLVPGMLVAVTKGLSVGEASGLRVPHATSPPTASAASRGMSLRLTTGP
jgi:hypothetical protein